MNRILIISAVFLFSPLALGMTWQPTLDNTPNLHTTTLELKASLEEPAPDRVVIDLAYMDEGVWRAERRVAGEGPMDVTLSPADFKCVKPGKTGCPLHFYGVTKVDVTVDGEKDDGIAQVECVWTGDTQEVFPWEQDPEPVGEEEGMTFWPGAYRNNGGHFAWRYEPNGLLINNVSFDRIERSWYYFKPGRDKESFQFNFRIPGALAPEKKVVEKAGDGTATSGIEHHDEYKVDGGRLRGKPVSRSATATYPEAVLSAQEGIYENDEIEADWTSFRWRRKVKTEVGAEYTQELRYSILAPGIQVETDAPAFALTFQNRDAEKGPAGMAYLGPDGARVVKIKDGIDPKAMQENWLVLLANDGTPEIPVMVVFQHRPDRFEWTKAGLTIHRADGVGTLALATPYGAVVLTRSALSDWQMWTQGLPVTQRFHKVIDLLTAYPWKCRETFAVQDGSVHIRDTIEYLPWQDDWGTQPKQYAPLPPLVAYSSELGYLPANCVKDYTAMLIPTKWGPYWVREGDTIDYWLPIPKAWDHAPLGVKPAEDTDWLYENLMRSLKPEAFEKLRREPPAPVYYPHCAAHDFHAGAWRTANFMAPEQRQVLRELTGTSVLSALFPQNYRYRRDPITGAQYVACTFAWSRADQVNSDGTADIDYWQGLVLYGLYTHAKYGADWATMHANWPVIRSMLSYWEALHSWALMGPGARESGASYHGDMATAGYAGLVGFYRLAQQLGTPYQRDLAAYLLAKIAVPIAAKFGFKPYAQHKLRHQEAQGSTGECTGFGERWVASFPTVRNDIRDNKTGDPWWQTGCIGPQSVQFETHDLLMRRCWNDTCQFEETFMKNCPDEGLRTREPTRVIPHVFLRTWLGTDLRTSALGLLKNYHKTYRLRDTHVIAAILAWDCPVHLVDWAPAYVQAATWDDESGTAEIRVDAGDDGAQVRLAVKMAAYRVDLDGNPAEAPKLDESGDFTLVAVDVPAGVHVVTLSRTDE